MMIVVQFPNKSKLRLFCGSGAISFEGEWQGNHSVVIEFESREAIEAWYNSPEYAQAHPFREAVTSMNNIVIADGFVMPK